MRTLLVLGCLLLAGTASTGDAQPAHSAAFVVIVHADNPVRAIARDDLSKIFLKRTVKWPDGKVVEPVDLVPAAASRNAFTAGVHRKSVAAIRAFWQQQIFSGRDVPPPEKATDADVTDFVKEHAGAVGYVSPTATLPAGVKSIRVEGVARD
jgi:ABC-type phosphate transport system substrate-binding protein